MTTTTCELKPSFYFQAIVNTLLHRFLSVALNQGSSFTSIVETKFFFSQISASRTFSARKTGVPSLELLM